MVNVTSVSDLAKKIYPNPNGHKYDFFARISSRLHTWSFTNSFTFLVNPTLLTVKTLRFCLIENSRNVKWHYYWLLFFYTFISMSNAFHFMLFFFLSEKCWSGDHDRSWKLPLRVKFGSTYCWILKHKHRVWCKFLTYAFNSSG